MPSPAELSQAASDPQSDQYDRQSPHYDVTADPSSAFYIGPLEDLVRSGDDIRAEITAEVNDDPLARELSEKERDALIQSRYLDAVSQARGGLDEDLELRAAGAPPRTLWGNASHEQMIETLNNEADSVAIAETSEEWVRLGNEFTVHQRIVADAVDDSMGDWTGEGGDAARRHLADVAKWLGGTAQGAVLTGRQQQIHSQTLNESQKQMAAHPPVQFSPQEANARLQQITDPVEYATAAHQAIQTMQAQQASREQAARIMTQFDDTVGTAVDMPLFSPPPKLAGLKSASDDALTRDALAGGGAGAAGMPATNLAPDGGAGMGRGVPGTGGQDSLAASGAGPNAGLGTPPGGNPGGLPEGIGSDVGGGAPGGTPMPPPVSVPDVPTGSGGTGGFSGGNVPGVSAPDIPETQRFRDITDLPDSSGTTASSYTAPDLTQPGMGKTPTPGWSGGVNADSIASRLAGTGTGGGGAPGAMHVGGLGGASVGGGGASGLGGGTPGGGASSGAGARGPGALGEGGQARSAPGTGGQSGRAGMPAGGMAPGAGAGGGKGKGSEDEEHRVAGYLLGDDELFIAEQAVAPPVIGDWQQNRNGDWR